MLPRRSTYGRTRVVVIGMGDTGVLVATHLGRSFDVVGVSTKPALVSGQELGTRLADPDLWRRNYLTPLDRFRRLDRVRTVHGAVKALDTDAKLVEVADAGGALVSLPYDVAVIASGTTNGFWRRSEVEDLAAVEAGITEVATSIDRASSIAIIGGGPTGVSSAYNLAKRRAGLDVHLFYAQDEPLPGYHPKTRRRLIRELAEAGVHLHPGHRASVPAGSPTDRLTTAPVEWTTGQEPFVADLVLWSIGDVQPNSGFLPREMLDEHGFVMVDEHLRVQSHRDIYAVGDVAASDPARSSARNFGYRVVVRNIRRAERGSTKLVSFTPPKYRWGSIVGLQDDGMVIHQPNGSAFRVPRWAAQRVLMDVLNRTAIYGGVRSGRRTSR
ncbi:FAD-dependent oxidoreductase [Dermatobacter hominis]|uniref:FAD-dependent oxidoreductase n=1 Tax=Dermatobacter hominis TaxID=2884263 RepID=UPI001D1197AA|nr:FAD-dependent oxidoreductase [Dermatobacter hominis]UDY34537.1 FAD-dependent oxidoreductase [Dermatobacter hominis]